ncbi:MAG: hypothetical protein KDH09_13000 [Chrysiogenetes bacterium]|nr:hypothetical protein [Chrysiogenetes bacterium]
MFVPTKHGGILLWLLIVLLGGCSIARHTLTPRADPRIIDAPMVESAAVEIRRLRFMKGINALVVENYEGRSKAAKAEELQKEYLLNLLQKTSRCAVLNSGMAARVMPDESLNQGRADILLRLELTISADESWIAYGQKFLGFITLAFVPVKWRETYDLQLAMLSTKGDLLGDVSATASYTKMIGWFAFPVGHYETGAERIRGDTFYYMTLDALARLTETGAWDRLAPPADATSEPLPPSVREAPGSPR